MELMFVALAGLAIGAIARYALPHRSTYGEFLLPAIGLIVAAISFAALTWLGFTADDGWIWTLSLGLSVVTAVASAALLPRRRLAADARLMTRLNRNV